MTEGKKYWLVNGTSAGQVERQTGLKAIETDLGTLVERPEAVNPDAALDRLDRALRPNRCTCGAYAIIHRPSCPAGVI